VKKSRRTTPATHGAPRRRRGLSVIEVLVAVVIFGIATTGLAAMTFWVGTRGGAARMANQRAGVVAQLGDQFASLPFDSLASRGGCQESADNGFAYIRCVRVDALSEQVRRVTLTVTPLVRTIAPDTLVVERARSRPYNPLQ
jgi:prepilin-type N-terminal cleavage/methylation domain-containing protein